MKQTVLNHIKNIPGWRTKRKLVAIAVDDYGNVRLDSKKALEQLRKKGISSSNRFDTYDTLETTSDLEALYDTLSSVKDKNGNSAVFTPYALSCNIDFEKIEREDKREYYFEMLPETFAKVEARQPDAYTDTWKLWQQGLNEGLMKPEFHGREHLNLKIFNDLLSARNKNLQHVLETRSYVSIPEHQRYNHSWTASYAFEHIDETDGFLDNITDGLTKFFDVFGYHSTVFTPPAQQFPLHLEADLKASGLTYIDRPLRMKRYLGEGKYKHQYHYLGGGKSIKHMVRNVVFEPTDSRISAWVDYAFKQVETAFYWNKPAIISTHRVNFCGLIDENNRKKGLTDLKGLLQKISTRFPEVEYVSVGELGAIMDSKR